MTVVYLVGFMGCGKSAVGAVLAARLGVRFVDLDEEVVKRCGGTVSEIFLRHGEAAFRAEERRILLESAAGRRGVVATGAGTFGWGAHRELIASSGGISVYLELPWPALAQRLSGKRRDRPVFASEDEARALYAVRIPLYATADLRVVAEGADSPEEVARRVAEALWSSRRWHSQGS